MIIVGGPLVAEVEALTGTTIDGSGTVLIGPLMLYMLTIYHLVAGNVD